MIKFITFNESARASLFYTSCAYIIMVVWLPIVMYNKVLFYLQGEPYLNLAIVVILTNNCLIIIFRVLFEF